MEKTVQITIGGTQFQITEAAYEKLSAYIQSLERHFAHEADSREIMRDIESRIAEKLLETRSGIVKESDVDRVIEDMGSASQMETEEMAGEAAQSTAKKLYRDIDNGILAGVAAGLAAYFNIDVLWVRLTFIASVFFGGFGILIYLLLVLLVPAAKTASQKLEMRGSAVTLDAITRIVKERIEETTQSGALERGLGSIKRFALALLRIARTLVGGALFAGSFFAILGITVVCAITIANWNTQYVDSVIREIATPGILWSALIAGYLSIVIPLVLVASLGARLVRKRLALQSGVGFGLVGLWCLAVIASGAIATRVVGDYYALTLSHPDYAESSEVREIDGFSELRALDSSVVVREGDIQTVSIEGTERTRGFVATSVENGVLTVSTTRPDETCILFCNHSHPTVVITTPDLDAVTVEDGTIVLEDLITPALRIDADRASVRADVATAELTMSIERSSVRGDIDTESLSLVADDSYTNLEGSVSDASVQISQSSAFMGSLIAETMDITVVDSHAQVNVTSVLTVTEDRHSLIENEGAASLNE